MRTKTVLALSVLAVSLAACQPQQEARGARTEPLTLTLEAPARGELTTQSPININDGSRYAVVNVNLRAGATTRIALEGALQGVLSLYQDGELLNASNTHFSYGDGGSSGGKPRVELVHSAEADGEFQLGVSGADATRYGPFRVVAQEIQVRNSGEVKPGESLEGALTGATQSNQGANVYEFVVADAGLYVITLRSQAFDAFLKLTGQGVDLDDDDSGGGSDAKLTAFLEPGKYELRASGLGDGTAGLYSLAVEHQPLPAGTRLSNGGELPLDETITGMYTGREMNFQMELTERKRVVIDMKSSAIDSYLTLDGPGVHATDDDSGGGSDARIERVLAPGKYTVVASDYDSGTGLFTLGVQTSDAPEPGGGDIAVGQTVRGELVPNEADIFKLQIERPGTYTIDMRSEVVDSFLRIHGNGVEREDDDSGGNYDARLNVALTPGEYTIEASAFDSDSGPYTLSVR